MYTTQWKNIAQTFLHNWFVLRKSMYFICIKDIFFCEKKRQILVKYQCSNKRVGDIITLDDFMSSPLKHATHPDQIFYIGTQTEKLLAILNKIKDTRASETRDIAEQLSRFKRIFYKDDV